MKTHDIPTMPNLRIPNPRQHHILPRMRTPTSTIIEIEPEKIPIPEIPDYPDEIEWDEDDDEPNWDI